MGEYERIQLARVSRYAREHGWHTFGLGIGMWRRANTFVVWDRPGKTLSVLMTDRHDIRQAVVPIDSTQQAVDILVALRLLPLGMSLAFEAGKRFAIGRFSPCGYQELPAPERLRAVAA